MSIIHDTFEKSKWFLINELHDILAVKEMTMRKREMISRTLEDIKHLFEAHTLGHELGVEEEEESEVKYDNSARTEKPVVMHK